MNCKLLPAALVLLGLHTGLARADARADRPLDTIASLDLKRYMGTWYELARFPNDFQKKCVSNVTATYKLREDGKIDVINRCRVKDGDVELAEGVARQTGEAASPKLEVRFAPDIVSFLPMVWGDYWVIDLDPAYQLSAVSEPKREYLWILARTPYVDQAAYDALLARLASQGFDLSKLVRTSHKQ